jgi:hypothetical protein
LTEIYLYILIAMVLKGSALMIKTQGVFPLDSQSGHFLVGIFLTCLENIKFAFNHLFY